jgi:hypothetical protein
MYNCSDIDIGNKVEYIAKKHKNFEALKEVEKSYLTQRGEY